MNGHDDRNLKSVGHYWIRFKIVIYKMEVLVTAARSDGLHHTSIGPVPHEAISHELDEGLATRE